MASLPFYFSFSLCLCLLVVIVRFLEKLWWTPIRMQSKMRSQGIKGPSYRFLYGNTKEILSMVGSASSSPQELSHTAFRVIQPHIYSWIKLYGSNFLYWLGSRPQLVVTEPDMIKEILNGVFTKPNNSIIAKKILGDGLVTSEGKKWSKMRRLANHAFHLESLKSMIPAMIASVEMVLERWRNHEGKEIEVFEEFKLLTSEIISRTAFGSSYSEGQHIFEMLTKLVSISSENSLKVRIPVICNLFKTQDDVEADKLEKGIRNSIINLIKEREKKAEKLEKPNDYGNDLLGLLVNAYRDSDKTKKISIDDVIDECNTFYLGGHETSTSALSWIILLLAIYADWQDKAREEVVGLLGKGRGCWVQTIQRKFLWRGFKSGRGMCNVRWSKVCLNKSFGGLGIGSLQSMNLALLFKWKWRALSVDPGFWKSIIPVESFSVSSNNRSFSCSNVWKTIISVRSEGVSWGLFLNSKLSVKIGNGMRTPFWHASWCGQLPLKDLHPRLYVLSICKEASVADMGKWEEGEWRWSLPWRRRLRPWEEIDYSNCLLLISGTRLDPNMQDHLLWEGSSEGFSVKNCRKSLESFWHSSELRSMPNLWRWRVSSKKQILLWIACHERLSSKLFLAQRGVIQCEDTWCHQCRTHIEDSNHILINCDLAWKVWMSALSRWGVAGPLAGNVTDFYLQWDFLIENNKYRSLWNVLLFEIAWALWINRNKAIFDQETYVLKTDQDIFLEACRQSFWWARNNIKNFTFSPSELLAVSNWGSL